MSLSESEGTPLAKILELDPVLFDSPDDRDVDELLSCDFLKKDQLIRFNEFIEKDYLKCNRSVASSKFLLRKTLRVKNVIIKKQKKH